MIKRYSNEIRQRVVSYVHDGHSKRKAARQFEISYTTIWLWCNRQKHEGHCNARLPGDKLGRGKIGQVRLQADVAAYPDASLAARAERFGVSKVAIFRALKRMNIPYNKSRTRTERMLAAGSKPGDHVYIVPVLPDQSRL